MEHYTALGDEAPSTLHLHLHLILHRTLNPKRFFCMATTQRKSKYTRVSLKDVFLSGMFYLEEGIRVKVGGGAGRGHAVHVTRWS